MQSVLILYNFRVDSIWVNYGFRVGSIYGYMYGFRVGSIWVNVRILCGFRVGSILVHVRISCGFLADFVGVPHRCMYEFRADFVWKGYSNLVWKVVAKSHTFPINFPHLQLVYFRTNLVRRCLLGSSRMTLGDYNKSENYA